MSDLHRSDSIGRRIGFAKFVNQSNSTTEVAAKGETKDPKRTASSSNIQPQAQDPPTDSKTDKAHQKTLHNDPESSVGRERRRSSKGHRESYTAIVINKVPPAQVTESKEDVAPIPEPSLGVQLAQPAEADKLKKAYKKGAAGTGLTILPHTHAFTEGLLEPPPPNKPKPVVKEKEKEVFEVQMPKFKKKSHALSFRGGRQYVLGAVPTFKHAKANPNKHEDFTSLVDKLKAMYGHPTTTTKQKKKKAKKEHDSSDSTDEELRNQKAAQVKDELAEQLTKKLYGDQVEVLEEFLKVRRDCERELIKEKATIPAWVRLFWKVSLAYELATSCLLLFIVFYGTFAAIFKNHSSDAALLGQLDYCIEIDCILRLCVELWRSINNCQYEVFTVNYTFILALLDLIALTPGAYIYMAFGDSSAISQLETIPAFFFLKLLHVFRMITILDKLQNDMNIGGDLQFVIAMARYLIQYMLTVHLLSCLIFFVGQRSYMDWLLNRNPESQSEKEYVTFLSLRTHLAEPPEEYYILYPEPISLYTFSVYLVVATISTVGFGDIYPTNNTERILIILMMMVGSIWISGELAYNLGTFFTDLDAARYMMFFRVNCIKTHLQNYQVSNFILTRTEEYYLHLWRYRKGVHEIDLSYLPHCVQEELKFDVCEEMLFKSSMFRGLDETFLMVLAKSAKVALYSPKMILYERGSITKQMCFILQGEVAVAADLDDDKISAIHRGGCLIGEINLFMAIPYEQTTYTRTVCTIMTITKKDLMLALQNFPHVFAIIRDRMKKRREKFRNAFNLVQVNPYVQWMYPKSLECLECDPEFPVKVNRAKGWNRPVTGFPMENEDEQVIIEMPCLRPDLSRGELQTYRIVSVPQIYYSPGFWATNLNGLMLLVWFYMSWVIPGCMAYDDAEGTYFNACIAISYYWPGIICVCFIDVFVELVTACPSTGLYYKIMDGITVKRASAGFYCDLLSLIPFELIYPHSWLSSLIRMILKFWKIGRLWNYLDERFALKLFYIRIAKMTYYLIYITYVLALFLLCLVCEPGRKSTKCREISFYNPTYPTSRLQRVKARENADQYIIKTPLVFAASTLTSVGFGNIFPQTTKEIIWTSVFMIVGHFFCSYILAQLTSALTARLTPQLIFHQKLIVVKTFVRHNGLSTKLLRKLVEHYDLQHQYVRGCSLPQSTHLMYDGHKVLLEDVFLVEGEIFFDGVPAFSKIPSQAIIDMSRLMKRFVVPPDLVFVQRGEVRRTLYIIVNGSVALYQHGEKEASAILTSTGHFGLRDLLIGEPYPYKVKTLSYVILYAVDYATFHEVLGDDEGLVEFIKDETKRREDEIRENLFTKIVDDNDNDISKREVFPPSWITYADHPDKPALNGDKSYDHFEKPFLYYRGSNFIRENTLSSVLHPAGTFGMVWQIIMGLAAVANVTFLIIETYMGYKAPELRFLQIALDLLFYADIYLKCHWAYYSEGEGEMRYHPLKTWVRYVFRGPFFIEVAMMIPLELMLAFSGSTNLLGYGPGHSWYSKLRWIRFLRCYKFIELYTIVHRIFENRTTITFLFYLSITILMSVFLAAIGFFLACPTTGYLWNDGDEYKMPVCLTGTWVDQKAKEKLDTLERWNRSLAVKIAKGESVSLRTSFDEVFYARTFIERLVLGLYYVGQVLMVIGFGDLANFREVELNFLTSVALFGFIVCRAIISDVTSAQVDTNEVRAVYREKLERLGIALSREGAEASFKRYVQVAFRLSWSYAKGLQPNELFTDLHPVLHRELLREYFGDVLDTVPMFLGFTDAVVNAIKCTMKSEYYPKGGAVTTAGDLDYHMYVIVKGDVWVCDKDDKWLCTMSTGESIGEMSMLYSAKRRFSAYAATNLQLLVLEATAFAALLERYPMQREILIRNLLDYKRETYLIKAWKLSRKDPKGYMAEQEEKSRLLKTFVIQSIAHIPVRGNVQLTEEEEKLVGRKEPKFYQRIIGYGSSDVIDYYIYFVSDDDKFNFVLHPACYFMQNFQFILQLIRFIDPMIVLFHIFFYKDDESDYDVTKWTTKMGTFFDIILWINMVLRCFTAVEVSERKTYCKDLKKIIADYILSPQNFAYDLLVSFPYDLATGDKSTPLLGLRCLLTVKYFAVLFKLKEDIESSTLKVNIFTSTSFLIYLSHILACLFFWLSCPNIQDGLDACKTSGWVHKFRIEFGRTVGKVNKTADASSLELLDMYVDNRPSHWYIIALYWVMAVLTTCGFGDITPYNFEEILLAVFCIFFGSLFLSILLGNITTGLSSVNKAKVEFLGRVKKMLDYLQVIGLSDVGHQTLSAYCQMTWNNCRGVNYNDIPEILPLYVQKDVYLALYHKCVTNCLFFGRNYELSFVRAVCPRLRHYMFLPGMRIANEMEPGTGIFIVMRGAVTSFQTNPETGEHDFIKRYEKNQVFGRIPALFPGALYNKSYRAEEKTEVLIMYHADMRQLLTKYPRWKIFLKELISHEYIYFSKKSDLKNITASKLEMDEKLKKELKIEDFAKAASLFATEPPNRTGKNIKEPKLRRKTSTSHVPPPPEPAPEKPPARKTVVNLKLPSASSSATNLARSESDLHVTSKTFLNDGSAAKKDKAETETETVTESLTETESAFSIQAKKL